MSDLLHDRARSVFPTPKDTSVPVGPAALATGTPISHGSQMQKGQYSSGKQSYWCIANNNKLSEELIAYFPITVICAPDTNFRKKTSVCRHNEVNKAVQIGSLQCWYYWWE
jgi:hypothetical protein